MVRTTGGVRISAGKQSKKGGGGGGSSSTPSTPSGRSSNKGGSRLPPIPHCEAPSWQKPITNFFNAGASSSRDEEKVIEPIHENGNTKTKEENNMNVGNSNDVTEIAEDAAKDDGEVENENMDDLNISGDKEER